ncbi:hypothetical protein ACFSTC_20650 [Nonomuraea ferruginea]
MALTEQRPAERAGIRHPWRAVLISSLIGFLLTVVWSAEFVDSVIGENVAGTVLGQEPEATVLDGILPGIVFAFATGLGGTFTACNIAVLGALCPIVGQPRSLSDRVGAVFKPLAWLTVGMLTVSGVYGAVVGIVGTAMPQFSTAPHPPGGAVGQERPVDGGVRRDRAGVRLARAGRARHRARPARPAHPALPQRAHGGHGSAHRRLPHRTAVRTVPAAVPGRRREPQPALRGAGVHAAVRGEHRDPHGALRPARGGHGRPGAGLVRRPARPSSPSSRERPSSSSGSSPSCTGTYGCWPDASSSPGTR